MGDLLDNVVTIKVYLQDEDEEFESWMQTIHVSCSLEGEEVGRGYGKYVRRDRIASQFWQSMEEPSQDLASVAFEVFDRYGRLKKELAEHIFRKGTGCWGHELDTGSLFIIEHLCIDKLWRRKGLGKMMTKSIIKKARSGGRHPAFIIVSPGWLSFDIKEETYGKTKQEERQICADALNAAKSFYRSFGFRRIGASSCFGLATEPEHGVHQLPSHDDFDPPEREAEEDDGEIIGQANQSFEDLVEAAQGLKLFQAHHPLHHGATTLEDSECVKFYSGFAPPGSSRETWAEVNSARNNILHLAASRGKYKSVQWLLENADEDQVLSSGRNENGYTPLEQLQSDLESIRTKREVGTMIVCMSDQFCGFPEQAIDCLVALQSIKTPTNIQLLQLKYGCTCGECVDGFLSPRMKFALLCQAEVANDMVNEAIDDGEEWCLWHADMICHVAPDIQRNFKTNKSLRQGFCNIFGHAATALRSNKAPTEANVLAAWRNDGEWPPVTRNFLVRGGKASNVVRTIFEFARDQDEWAGDGEHMNTFEKDISVMPVCRNDHEFGFVALACGLPDL